VARDEKRQMQSTRESCRSLRTIPLGARKFNTDFPAVELGLNSDDPTAMDCLVHDNVALSSTPPDNNQSIDCATTHIYIIYSRSIPAAGVVALLRRSALGSWDRSSARMQAQFKDGPNQYASRDSLGSHAL
jgi:hypothetical protein